MPTTTRDLSATRTLTNTAIDAMEPGAVLKDNLVPGLQVRANARGKSFLLYYRVKEGVHAGEPRRPKLGDWGILTIAQARELARTMLARVAMGEDPGGERDADRQAPVMSDLWSRCEREHWNRGTTWDQEAKRIWGRNLRPALGTKRVRAVSYDDCAAVRDSLKDRPAQANMAIAVLSKMFALAETFGPEGNKWRAQGSNPCQNVKRFPKRKRRRKAQPAEIGNIGRLLQAELDAPAPENFAPFGSKDEWLLNIRRQVAFVYLLLFSGGRPSEVINLEPHMIERFVIDGVVHGAYSVHGKTSDETGEDRRVYLPPPAMAVIDMLPIEGIRTQNRRGEPGRHTATGLAGVPRNLWDRIKPPGMWLRDCRRTFGSVALSEGITRDQLGELLGHSSQQTTMIYSKLYEEPAMRAAAMTAGRMAEMLLPAPKAKHAEQNGAEILQIKHG